MAKTDMDKFAKYNGYKFFKYDEETNTAEIVRIIGIKEFNEKFKIKNEETGKVSTITYGRLKDEYTPLEPKGFVIFVSVWVEDTHGTKSDDVIVSAYDMNHLKIFGDQTPYVVCRQSVNDIFYTALKTNEDKEMVGCCISKDTIPQNIMMADLLQCSGVYSSQIVNYYIEDTVETLLECLDIEPYDTLLEKLFKHHLKVKNRNNPLFNYEACKLKQSDGWCRTLSTLLHENNFITDLDAMRNIQALDFDLSEFIIPAVRPEEDPDKMSNEMLLWLSKTYRISLKEAYVMEYSHDIDLAQFADTAYMLFRDNTDTTYLVIFVPDGEFLESELEEKYKEVSPSDKIRLAFYNKYQGLEGESYKDIIKN